MLKYIVFSIFILSLFSCERVQINTTKSIDNDVVDCSKISYSKDVWPIINANCTTSSCHPYYTQFQIVQIRAKNGMLDFHVVTNKDMPIGGTLSTGDIAKIKCWIDGGALNN